MLPMFKVRVSNESKFVFMCCTVRYQLVGRGRIVGRPSHSQSEDPGSNPISSASKLRQFSLPHLSFGSG